MVMLGITAMPGSGKGTVCSLAAEILGREIFNVDEYITNQMRAMSLISKKGQIEDYIKKYGQKSFRAFEHIVGTYGISEFAKKNGPDFIGDYGGGNFASLTDTLSEDDIEMITHYRNMNVEHARGLGIIIGMLPYKNQPEKSAKVLSKKRDGNRPNLSATDDPIEDAKSRLLLREPLYEDAADIMFYFGEDKPRAKHREEARPFVQRMCDEFLKLEERFVELRS